MGDGALKLGAGEKTILCIGAHPDDCEMSCSGTAAGWAASGNRVVLMSVTDGSSGHHLLSAAEVVQRRRVEAKAAAAIIGAESIVLRARDGFLEATLENRLEIIRVIRVEKPDVIITNRPNDYHPDHRYTSLLVQDAAYMLMVPHVLPEVEPLSYNPVILYWADTFTYPRPFRPDMVVSVDGVMDKKLAMLECHESQVFEWLPWIERYPVPVPTSRGERKKWLEDYYNKRRKGKLAESYRKALIGRYGESTGNAVIHAEAFELCEYGTMPDTDKLESIFQDA